MYIYIYFLNLNITVHLFIRNFFNDSIFINLLF